MAYPIPKEEYIDRINSTGRYKFISFHSEFKNAKSRANVECLRCGLRWDACIHTLATGSSGCRLCANKIISSKKSLSSDMYERRVNESGFAKFIKWNSDKFHAKSKITALCLLCESEYTTTPDLVRRGAGCGKCKGERISESKRVDDSFWIEKINLSGNGVFRFVEWEDGFRNAYSRAIIECKNGHHWNSTPDSIVHGSGCPRCARRGFDQTSDAYVYSMLSECGRYLKVGISGALDRRIANLKLDTPFDFSVYSLFKTGGKNAMKIEKDIHSRYERAGFSGFQGSTEWMIATRELLDEMKGMGR